MLIFKGVLSCLELWNCYPASFGRANVTSLPFRFWYDSDTPPKFNSSPLKIGNPKRKLIFQPSIIRGYVKLPGGKSLASYFGQHFCSFVGDVSSATPGEASCLSTCCEKRPHQEFSVKMTGPPILFL